MVSIILDYLHAGESGEEILRQYPTLQPGDLDFDVDFADIRHYPPGSHAGVDVFPLWDQRWRSMEQTVNRFLSSGIL
jgi:Protein of unknown function (DUF433)